MMFKRGQLCLLLGVRSRAIDLCFRLRRGYAGHGGISREAALDQSTMRICRAEIARCQAVRPP
jgi:hypothetical protein